jgi:hypothetical protein
MSLIGWWPLHDGSATDYSGNGNHGTLNGGVTTGVAGCGGLEAMSFDGTDDYVDIGAFPELSSYTVSLWVSDDEPSSGFFHEYVRIASNNDISLQKTDADEWVIFHHDGSAVHRVGSTPATSGWTHLAATWTGDTLSIHVNGSKDGAESVSGMQARGRSADYIAGSPEGNGNYSPASLADARLYSRALSDSEIQTLYEWGGADLAQPPTDGVARYALDGDATDSWGSNDGTTNGGLSWSSDAIRGQSADFDGSDDLVDLPHVPSGSELTISGWFNTDDAAKVGAIAALKYNWNHRVRTNSGNLDFSVRDPSKGNTTTINTSISPGVWYYFTAVYRSNGDMELYLNGERKATDNYSFGAAGNDDRLGHSAGDGRFFDGQLDDVRIYDYALSPSEVFQNYLWGTRGRDLRKDLVNARK